MDDVNFDPYVRITPWQEYMRRTLPRDPEDRPRNVGPYMDDEQARDQFEADAQRLGVVTADDLARANVRLLCEALAAADVAVTEYELDEIRALARHDYATVQVIIGWIWRARGSNGST